MVTLRHFNASDIPALQQYDYPQSSDEQLQTTVDAWNTKVYNGAYFEMFAVVDDGIIVGKASLLQRAQHIVSCGIDIYQPYRHNGLASHAYTKLLAAAKQNGYTIALAQVRADNDASIALHKKIGFEAEDYIYTNKKNNPVYIFIKAL